MPTSKGSSSCSRGSCRFWCPNCKQDLPETCYCDGPLRCKTSGTLRTRVVVLLPVRRIEYVFIHRTRLHNHSSTRVGVDGEDQCGYFVRLDDPSESALQRKMEEVIYELEASRAECIAANQRTRRLLRGSQCGWLFVFILVLYILVI